MILVILIDLLLVAMLFYKSSQKGVENALPAFTFFTVLLPENCQIPLPGLFGLTAQRLAVVILLLCFLIFKPKRDLPTNQNSTPLVFLICLQLVWALVSSANSIVPVMSLKKLLSVILEYYAVYFIFFKSISTPATIKRIVTATVVAMAMTTIPGVVEAYTGWQVTSWFPDIGARFGFGNLDEARGIRTQSTFQHAILYGGALAMALPLALYLIATAKSMIQKIFLWMSVLLMFLCLFKTTSRGPWMAAIFGFALVFIFTVRPIQKSMIVIIGLCVLVMVIRPGVYDTITDLYDETTNPDSTVGTSYEYRYALRDVSVKALSLSPIRALTGFGMESFYYLHLEGPFMGKEGHKFESCDSAWIETMIETGYVGLAIFALLLGSAFLRIFWSVFRLPKPDRYLQWIFAVNLIQYYFLMISVAIYGWGQNGFMLWITIAAGLAYPRVAAEREMAPKFAGRDRSALKLTPGLATDERSKRSPIHQY
jgi:O-Antigen ligase